MTYNVHFKYNPKKWVCDSFFDSHEAWTNFIPSPHTITNSFWHMLRNHASPCILNSETQNHNFASSSVWIWSFVTQKHEDR